MAYFKYQDKDIFYEEYGQGEPIIFLHGNTASSKMSEFLMPLYTENFRCILIDFLGNGQSDRVESFSPDMWHDKALQTIALTEHLQCGKVSLIGTSGGAWAAVNAALERPDLFHAVVADSFDGRTLNENFSANLLSERKAAKEDAQSRQFYELCQGADWEKVVDLDTEALLKCSEEKRPLFHKPLEELKTPILFSYVLVYEFLYQRCGLFRIGKKRGMSAAWKKKYRRLRTLRSHFFVFFFHVVPATFIFSTSHE